jgi:DNA-binding Lrp family transcriptional regulator
VAHPIDQDHSGAKQADRNSPFLDDLDRELINRLQSDFPITSRPFLEIGGMVGLTEEEVIRRLSRLTALGVIRRIGANIVPQKVGFTSTLCAAHVPEELIDGFIETVNRYPGVTHNYLRQHKYNVWFTFIGPSIEEIERCLMEIKKATGISEILNMPATKVFKLRAEFEV